jgi:hypothetical protein
VKPGDVVSVSSPSEALGPSTKQVRPMADPCDEYFEFRTIDLFLENRTPATAQIWFVQVLDTSGQAPPGFSADTGVYVGVVNGAAHSTYHSDPCRAGGRNQPIQGTVVKGSVKLVYQGREYDIPLEDIVAQAGNYYGTVGWEVTSSQLMNRIPEIAPFSVLPKRAPGQSVA